MSSPASGACRRNVIPAYSRSSAARWAALRSRTRCPKRILKRSMICPARTLPTPGSRSRNTEIFILPIASLDCAASNTSASVVTPLNSAATSSRSLLIMAAFSKAAARCSGVRGGRPMGHLGFLLTASPRPNRLPRCEAGDVPLLPRRLDGLPVVVLPDEGDRLIRRDSVEDSEAGQGGAGPSTATGARDLYALRRRAPPRLVQELPRPGPFGGQPEVGPAQPSALPADRGWC